MKQPLERREILLEKITDSLLANGIVDLSLRPLAKKVGTSARLLIYHFGTKEELLAAALVEVRERIEVSVRELAQREQPKSLQEFLLLFWNWALEPDHQRYFWLLFEVGGLSMYNRDKFSSAFRGTGFAKWVEVFEGSFDVLTADRGETPGASTLVVAVLKGLLHDYFATGDRERTTAALHYLLERLPDEEVKTSTGDEGGAR